MDMAGKSRNDNGSIRQKLQYRYFAKISETKSFIYETKSRKNIGKTGHLTFENLDLIFRSFVFLFICFRKL